MDGRTAAFIALVLAVALLIFGSTLLRPPTAQAVIIPWTPGSHQSPLSSAGAHHGGPEICWRWDSWPPGYQECELLTRPRRAIRRHLLDNRRKARYSVRIK